jgi:hypothetical protein
MEGDFFKRYIKWPQHINVHFDHFMWVQAGQPLLLLQFVVSEVSVLQLILRFYSPYIKNVLGIVCCVSYCVVLLRE